MPGPTPRLVVTRPGRPAARALRDAVAAAKDGDPLAPVTVVVPTNFAGVSLRRLLASGQLGPVTGGRGIANVAFATLYGLADRLGTPRLAAAGRIPISTPVLAAAIRRALRDEPGIFAPVATHPSTEQALVRAFAELSEASEATLDRLCDQSDRAAAVVDVVRRAWVHLPDRHDERDLLAAAADAVRDGAAGALGPVVVHLPQSATPAGAELLRVLADAVPVTIIAGFTGAAEADAPLRGLLERLDLEAGPAPAEEPATTRILVAPDPEEEVRLALREVMARVHAGTPVDRIAILYPRQHPYLLMLHEQLEAAGIPFTGPPVQRLAETAAGRMLLVALSLPDRDFRRDEVCALLSAAPMRTGAGHRVNTTAWERLSRRAGIVSGVDEWERRLASLAASQRARLDTEGELSDAKRSALERDVRAADELAVFVRGLAEVLSPREPDTRWVARGERARALLRRHLDQRALDRGPEEEAEALERVEAALDRLAELDAIDPDPDDALFRRTLEAELDAPARRHGTFGDGVLIAPLHLAPGLDLDAVVVLGLAEGILPAAPGDDVAIPDRERERATADRLELPLHTARLGEQHRDLLAGVGAAPDRVLCAPRADGRRGRDLVPSRWLLEAAGELAGRPLGAEDLAASLEAEPWGDTVASYTAGLARLAAGAAEPAGAHERDLALLLGGALAPDPSSDLAAGLEVIEARRSGGFTRFAGNLTGAGIGGIDDRVLSATSLESWATCPFSWFLSQALGLADLPVPEEVRRIEAAERGRLVHEILEDFMGEVLEAGGIAPSEPWSPEHRSRLLAHAEAHFDRFERDGVVGTPVSWRFEKRRIRRDLDALLEFDEHQRAALGVAPSHIEMAFGLDGERPVELRRRDGRTLRFRGKADRVDTGPDRIAVIDYKTGSTKPYDSLAKEDPVKAGTRLQLPLYGLAARQRLGRDDAAVRAGYWFVSGVGGPSQVGYDLAPAVMERFTDVVELIAAGIESGHFPARPGAYDSWSRRHENCRYCDFDRLCTADRGDDWERVREAPELADYVALAEGDEGGKAR